MAFYGLRKPYVAAYNKQTGQYSGGFVFGKAISVDITPNYVEGSLYADDEQAEYEKSFQNASVTLGTSTFPLQAASTVYGHTIDNATGKVLYKTTDESNNVGLGWTTVEVVNGVRSFIGFILTCVKFSEGQETFTTKGDNITFATPSQSGLAIGDANSVWKVRRVFDTAAEAEAFVKEYLNIDQEPTYTYTLVTPVGTENPHNEGWYEKNGTVYSLTEDTTVQYVYTAVTPEAGDNPSTEGWYELDGSTYVASEDTEVQSGKTYYSRAAKAYYTRSES